VLNRERQPRGAELSTELLQKRRKGSEATTFVGLQRQVTIQKVGVANRQGRDRPCGPRVAPGRPPGQKVVGAALTAPRSLQKRCACLALAKQVSTERRARRSRIVQLDSLPRERDDACFSWRVDASRGSEDRGFSGVGLGGSRSPGSDPTSTFREPTLGTAPSSATLQNGPVCCRHAFWMGAVY
jgi:hypothetical protein